MDTTGLLVLAAALVAVAGAALLIRTRDGRLRHEAGRAVDVRALGQEPGAQATLLQVSSAFCGPCRATRALLADVAARTPGVAHVEVDAADHVDLVRDLGVRRTPTVLLLDARGNVAHRASGVPTRCAVVIALAPLLG